MSLRLHFILVHPRPFPVLHPHRFTNLTTFSHGTYAEHVDGLHEVDVVLLVEDREVAGLRGRVPQLEVHDPGRCQFQEVAYHGFVHAGARPIGHHHIGLAGSSPRTRDSSTFFLHVARRELYIGYAVEFSVHTRIGHALGHEFHTGHMFGGRGEVERGTPPAPQYRLICSPRRLGPPGRASSGTWRWSAPVGLQEGLSVRCGNQVSLPPGPSGNSSTR